MHAVEITQSAEEPRSHCLQFTSKLKCCLQLSFIESQRSEPPRSQWIAFFGSSRNSAYICNRFEGSNDGGLAQLARALAWHARGHRFDSDILHLNRTDGVPLRCAVFVV